MVALSLLKLPIIQIKNIQRMEGLVKQVIGHKMIQEWIFYQSWWLMEFHSIS